MSYFTVSHSPDVKCQIQNYILVRWVLHEKIVQDYIVGGGADAGFIWCILCNVTIHGGAMVCIVSCGTLLLIAMEGILVDVLHGWTLQVRRGLG